MSIKKKLMLSSIVMLVLPIFIIGAHISIYFRTCFKLCAEYIYSN